MSELIETLEARQMYTAVAGTVDATKTFQTVDALGAASIAWENEPVDSDPAVYDKLVNDLGISGMRGAIWPNFEIVNDNYDPNVFDWSKFDSKQLGHVLQFDQRLQERGQKGGMILSVWTPPGWMKTNRSVYGAGSLRPDMRAEFAEYLAAVVIASKRDFGIDIAAISIQNEQFFPERYESSILDPQTMRDTLVAVQQKFAREHLSTKLIVNEDLALGTDAARWKWFNQLILDDDEIDRSKLIIGSHYPDPSNQVPQAQQLAGTGVPLWYTEMSGKSGDWIGGVKTADEISDLFTNAQASAYYYWTYNNTTNAAPADQTTSFMANGMPNSKYYALKHFYKYVRPGMQRIAATTNNSSLNHISAFRDPTTKATTIVITNDDPANVTSVTLNLTGLGAGTSAFRGFKSTKSATWVSMGNFTGSGSTLSVDVPPQGIVTLTNLPDTTPITNGKGNTLTPVDQPFDANLTAPLREAAILGDLAQVQSLLASGASVSGADPNTGWTALHAAASSVFPQAQLIVEALLAAGANPNAKDVDGFTPLHAAAMNQFVEYDTAADVKANIVHDLIAAGANPNARDNFGRTPLMWSALTTSVADVNVYNTGVPAMLLSNGADRTLKDNAGHTAYDDAASEYKSTYLPLLAGTNLDTQGPITRYATYLRDLNRVSIVLTEDVTASLDASDIQVTNRTTNASVAIGSFSELFSTGLTIARVNFATRLPDGHYRLAIAAGAVTDPNGKPAAAIAVDFDVLGGDANSDGKVDFNDLVILAQNYSQANRTYSQGDFNGDGKVTFDDLVILSQRYGTSLPPLLATDSIVQRHAAKVFLP